MELEKYIKAAKEVINVAYLGIQDALMQRDESLENLKNKGWNYKETAYQQEYQKIIDTFNQTTADTITTCKSKLLEQKNGYMEDVKTFYISDGSRIDLNFMNLIKAELPLTVEEITGEIMKNADNPTMLRVIHKYVLDRNAHSSATNRIKLDAPYMNILRRSSKRGEVEEKIFDSFIHLATMGMNHPDESFTLYQARLDDYEEDACLKILKAKTFIDDETKRRIAEIETQRIEKSNEKFKHSNIDYGWFHGYI